ncbi:nucleotide-diphospho-sugar transferase [Trichodelitschia bisporula]|uniref:Nucleotide-diphospho-sugar transferase n=1 Tax=Trichodelitschia bisporula TaxID=703511 RepID=A0A6G1HK25_9PEZI|nr:nucleotide-diphospho-sugar transferase [Trichodelitschia bisporula]
MRLTLPRLLLSALGLTIFTILYLSHPRLNAVYTYTYTPTPPPETSSPIISAFFQPWALLIHTTKPPISPLQIFWPAQNIPVTPSSPPRGPAAENHLDLSDADIASLRAAHATFRTALDQLDPSTISPFTGVGIVLVAGGEYFGPALVSLALLRQAGCDLPVEVFVADNSEYESALCEIELPALNARCVILSEYLTFSANSEGKTAHLAATHYQLKSLALLLSSFAEVLFLDSDSLPLLSPAALFASPAYTDTGLISWPDFWVRTEATAFYSVANISVPTDLPPASAEAGQLLVDKRRHLKTLLLAAYYNVWGPGWYYPLLSQGALGQGDKTTFEAAAVVLGMPYHRVQTPVRAVSRVVDGKERGSGMVQFAPGPEAGVAFLHANTPKMNAGHLVDEGDLVDGVGRHLRLWGGEEEQVALFGEDLERRVWGVLVEGGCRLEGVVEEWKGRGGVCGRLRGHWEAVFGGE